MAYSKFDFSDVKFSDELLTMEEALKNERPFEAPEEVLRGEKQMKITDAIFDGENRRVGLKIDYV